MIIVVYLDKKQRPSFLKSLYNILFTKYEEKSDNERKCKIYYRRDDIDLIKEYELELPNFYRNLVQLEGICKINKDTKTIINYKKNNTIKIYKIEDLIYNNSSDSEFENLDWLIISNFKIPYLITNVDKNLLRIRQTLFPIYCRTILDYYFAYAVEINKLPENTKRNLKVNPKDSIFALPCFYKVNLETGELESEITYDKLKCMVKFLNGEIELTTEQLKSSEKKIKELIIHDKKTIDEFLECINNKKTPYDILKEN